MTILHDSTPQYPATQLSTLCLCCPGTGGGCRRCLTFGDHNGDHSRQTLPGHCKYFYPVCQHRNILYNFSAKAHQIPWHVFDSRTPELSISQEQGRPHRWGLDRAWHRHPCSHRNLADKCPQRWVLYKGVILLWCISWSTCPVREEGDTVEEWQSYTKTVYQLKLWPPLEQATLLLSTVMCSSITILVCWTS